MNTRHTIIYAEDDPDDLYIVQQAFESYSFISLMHAGNGAEALQLLDSLQKANNLPCLLLLDINMPIMDGKETILKIKSDERFANLPVFLFSTSNSVTDRTFAEQNNVEMITKPLHYEDLQKIVSYLLTQCDFKNKQTQSVN